MVKICIAGPSKKYYSGVSAYTVHLANALSERNSISVLMLRDLLPRFLYPGKNNVGREDHSLSLNPEIKAFEGMDWYSPASWAGAYSFLKREKPEVVIAQWWSSAVAHMELFLAAVNRLKIKAAFILEMHEIVDPLEAGKCAIRLYSKAMSGLIISRTDACIVHSEPVKEQVRRLFRLPEGSIFVIPHGVYDGYFREYAREDARKELDIREEFVVLYFGMIRKYKGLPCLLEAFNRLPPEAAGASRLIIAGEDWGDEKGLGEMVGSSPYSGQITFRPEFVPDAEVPKYFSAADVVVLPYLRTSGSGVASLAMAYGKPLIISDIESVRSSLREYEGAAFVPCGDAAALSQKILETYLGQKKNGSRAYGVPAARSWHNIARQYERLIGEICGR